MSKFFCTLILALNLYTNMFAFNKIIYLISTPRSMSVAFMRMMQQRGDHIIFHEPSQCPFNTLTWPEMAKMVFKDNAPKTFEEVKANIFDAAKTKPVFVKEMVVAAHKIIPADLALLKNPDIYFVFLLRSPHATVTSYSKRAVNLPNDLADRIGCKVMYELFDVIQKNAKHKPLLILAEELFNDPVHIVQKFCGHVKIDFDEKYLSWPNLGPDFDGAIEWNEYKKIEFVQRWHGDAINSTGFGRPTKYEVNEQGEPTFSEVKNPEHKKLCIKAYEENLPYYNLLKQLIN